LDERQRNYFGKNASKNRAALLDAKDLPTGPIISNADGAKSQNRTYPDMLKNKNDEINFENIMTSELYKVNLMVLQLYSKADMYAEKASRLMEITLC
jgi:hypothetical protein